MNRDHKLESKKLDLFNNISHFYTKHRFFIANSAATGFSTIMGLTVHVGNIISVFFLSDYR